uniref:DUF4218 domain-containing protein n=2 Tax=Clytia hemisphaerica TaxID=252671 RepID=A0A7M5XIY5_9CNID
MRILVSHPYSTKAQLDETFRTDNSLMLPEENQMPKTYDEARRLIQPFLLPLEKYDCCIDDCMLFRGKNANAKDCIICGKARFDANGRPKRTFKYFPLGPRLARMIASPEFSELLEVKEVAEEGPVIDIQDTSTWKEWFTKDGHFGGRAGIALSFCTDGVNPLKSLDKEYSMWPLMIQVLNFPPAFRKNFAGIQLLGIIPGNGTKEPKHLEPYLEVMVEELQELSNCTMYIHNEEKHCQAKVLQFVHDFPAIAKVMHTQAQGGLRACPWCKSVGEHCKHLSKTVYLGNRKFLPEDSDLRKSTYFPDGKEEHSKAPEALTKDEQIELRREYDGKPNKTQKAKFLKENGVKGEYPFMELPYHGFHDDYSPDAMHTVRRVVGNIIHWLTQQKVKANTFAKVYNAETSRRSSELIGNLTFVMKEEEKAASNERIQNVHFPKEFSGFKGDVFTQTNKVLKDHHGWQEYTVNNIWVYAIHGRLPVQQQRTFNYFFAVLANLFVQEFEREQGLDALEQHLHQSLALLERDFPTTFMNITTHICHHFVSNMRKFGTLYASWMYSQERMNSWITRRCNNKARMESTVMNTYQLMDWVVYCTLTNKFPEANDPKNAISKKVLLATGTIEPTNERPVSKKRKHPKILKLSVVEVREVERLTGQTIQEVEQIDRVERTSKYGESYAVQKGSICPFNERKFIKVEELFKFGAFTMATVLFFNLYCDKETGIYYGKCNEDLPRGVIMTNSIQKPSVTASEDDRLWLLSKKPSLDFEWLSEHTRL